MVRPLVRVDFGDEDAWGEHVDGNVYRCLNECLSSVEAKFPDGHKFAEHNGKKKRLAWGDLFEAEPIPNRRSAVRALFVIGEDMSPRVE